MTQSFNPLFFLLSLSFFVFSCEKDEEVSIDLDTVTVRIISPVNQRTIGPSESVVFTGEVNIELSEDYSGLNVIWESNVDGILHEGSIDSDGITEFSSKNLSQNLHYIRLYISNIDNETIYDEIIVYNAIWLHKIDNNNNNSKIYWSKSDDKDFEAYELYRSYNINDIKNGNLIYSTSNLNDTTFIDTEAILGRKHFYKAFIKRKTNAPTYIGSNKDSIIAGDFIKLNYPLYKVIKDPNRNYAYGIVNLESIYSDNNTGYGLVFINTESKVVEKRILEQVRFTDLDISPSGDHLYLCARSPAIYRVNLNSKTVDNTFSIGNSAHKIEVGTNRLYSHITPPTSGSTEFRIYDLTNQKPVEYNTNIPDAYSSFRHGDFEIDANGTIYHGESNSSSSDLSKISTKDDVFDLDEQWSSGNYQRPLIILNNDKLYWNHYLFDTELNRLGEFLDDGEDINIQAVSPNGSLALGWSRLFDTQNRSVIKRIPVYYDNATFLENDYVLLIKNENPISNENNSTLFFYRFN